MKTQRTLQERCDKAKSGFALIATLILMILLAILAVGMLSLSAVSLRSGAADSAQKRAQANARIALMIAIGELQRNAGPDTRVTASADILDSSGGTPSNLSVTGVWKSWEGSDHIQSGASAGRPIAPEYAYKRVSESSGGRFLSWLISKPSSMNDENLIGDGPAFSVSDALRDVVRNTPFAGSVPLVSTGSLAAGDIREVHVVPIPIDDGSDQRGSFAWWVGGENQKARLPVPYKPKTDNVAGWSALAKSHAVADPSALELDTLLAADGPAKAAKAMSLGTTSLLAGNAVPDPDPAKQFHDLSTSSVGLLTNTATGGWRKDLTLVTENWATLPASGLPFFQINDTTTTSVTKPTTANPKAAQSIFYPWGAYNNWGVPANQLLMHQFGAVNSWSHLKDYAIAYKRPSITFPNYNISDMANAFTYLHNIRTPMAIVRVHWLFSHRTVPHPTLPDTYNLQMLITPVITMWNPYNLPIASPAGNITIMLRQTMPCAFRHYDRNGNPLSQYRAISSGFHPGVSYPPMGPQYLNYGIIKTTAPFTLAPGETRVFSPTSPTPVAISSATLDFSPGYRPGTGHMIDISSFAGPLDASSSVKVDVVCDTHYTITTGAKFMGIWVDIVKTGNMNDYRQLDRMDLPYTIASNYWPPIPASELASPSAQEINGMWTPFLSAVYGPRISGPSSNGLPGKGVLQSSPTVNFITMQANKPTPGRHPANATNDINFFKHTPNDSFLPNANNTNNRGYIISGFTPAEGISRVIMNEIPRRPLVSLAELQNWDMRSQNGYPPFRSYIIANSDASPIIPADNVINYSADEKTFQHDDSYCANHLLFDDWFFSSIAPKSASLAPPTASETLRKTFTDFVSGADPLPNRAYRPLHEDAAAAQTSGGADDLFTNHVSPQDSWQTIASRLEVEGMFNVNSTSVKAWRALLGHARNQKIPHHTEAGMSLSPETDHAHARFSVAGDVKAGDPGMAGFNGSSEITGYRVFDDALLDILATRIVEQVRLRGPFLSLSEFVNRQLTDDNTDLALAGAIQTALNQMSDDAGANDPYSILKSPAMSQDAGDPDDPKLAGANYVFKEAAVGKSTYGLPGWIRQADVLRPIAPILSARDDTFTIRAYGDARDATGKIIARATCEATVRRTRDFIDPSDAPDVTTSPTSAINQLFGRRFQIISFRWLNDSEI